MKNEWTEQDLRQFVESSRPVFQDVSLTQVDEDADRCWQDDGLMVDYELRGGQVDCVLRRRVVADGKVWQLQMTAPLAGNDLPEDKHISRLRPPAAALRRTRPMRRFVPVPTTVPAVCISAAHSSIHTAERLIASRRCLRRVFSRHPLLDECDPPYGIVHSA